LYAHEFGFFNTPLQATAILPVTQKGRKKLRRAGREVAIILGLADGDFNDSKTHEVFFKILLSTELRERGGSCSDFCTVTIQAPHPPSPQDT
jgi:hypothetical protein